MKKAVTILISKISIFSLIGVGLNIFLIYTFLKLWIHPQVSDIEIIFNLSFLMIFEFIMVHSGAFMSLLGRSWKGWLFFIVFYGLFALAFNAMVSSNEIIILYGAVVLNRMLPNILQKPNETDRAKGTIMSGLYAMIYLLLFFTIVLGVFRIPQFGLTKEFLQAANYSEVNKFDEGFARNPHVMMCFGVLYYLLLTLLDMMVITRTVKKALQE
jgi:hypothetical protein